MLRPIQAAPRKIHASISRQPLGGIPFLVSLFSSMAFSLPDLVFKLPKLGADNQFFLVTFFDASYNLCVDIE